MPQKITTSLTLGITTGDMLREKIEPEKMWLKNIELDQNQCYSLNLSFGIAIASINPWLNY